MGHLGLGTDQLAKYVLHLAPSVFPACEIGNRETPITVRPIFLLDPMCIVAVVGLHEAENNILFLDLFWMPHRLERASVVAAHYGVQAPTGLPVHHRRTLEELLVNHHVPQLAPAKFPGPVPRSHGPVVVIFTTGYTLMGFLQKDIPHWPWRWVRAGPRCTLPLDRGS